MADGVQATQTAPSDGDTPQRGPVVSAAQRSYFERLQAETNRCYAIAKRARSQGKDPKKEVEIPPAEDLAARVEAQVGPEGVAQRIRDTTKELGNRELVSLKVAGDIAKDLVAKGEGRERVVDQAVRTGLSILTEGVLVAPLEGIAEVKLGENNDGSQYLDLYFAGPIRAAGGTGQAMSVLIADVVRRSLDIDVYKPTDSEVERYKEEIPAYKQKANLQYTPTADEIEVIARNCPVCVNGEGTEQEEVTGNRDLPRVETNQLRGGACLVIAEGLVLKAPKLLKHVDKLGLEGWSFLERFIKKSGGDEGEEDEDAIPDIPPITKFIKDMIAGRPAFGYPSRPGAYRLRYGRSRIAGLASTSMHPASMIIVDDFLAVGTQLKTERPGKGTLATPCDTVEGPTIKHLDGTVERVATAARARELVPTVPQRMKGAPAPKFEILDLGEMLIPFGEFAENNALLPHASWCTEWWEQECEDKGFPSDDPGTPEGRVEHAETTGVPLHPEPTVLWHDVTALEIRALSDFVANNGRFDNGQLLLPVEPETKAILETLLVIHVVDSDTLAVPEYQAYALIRCLGLDVDEGKIVATERRSMLHDPCQPDLKSRYPTVELVSRLAGFPVMPRAPARIGARMGRPEKAGERKMDPASHSLFPIGPAGGNQRLVREAAMGKIAVELGTRKCPDCGRKNWAIRCECGGHTEFEEPRNSFEVEPTTVDLRTELEKARQAIGMGRLPDSIKAIPKLASKEKVPEPLEKGLLRARHKLWTFKDGTIRYDMTDIPITHFRPKEINATPEQLVKIGYTHDVEGEPLVYDHQMVELRVQDVIVSDGCMEYLVRAAAYVDELLESFYGLKPYYNIQASDEQSQILGGQRLAGVDPEKARSLIGAMAIGLAPHTSAGVLCRIIGWTKAQGHYGHPYFHAAKRRNCDGDEDAVMLLMDGLLNFSKSYIPDRRGGLMDLPLVLTTRLDPNEVDKEAHNVDTLYRYPLEFFRATTRHATPKEVGKMMGLVEDKIGTEAQYEGFGFTHDTADIAEGPKASAYKVLETTMDKLTAQMELARRIKAVDEAGVGATVIGTHLLPDIMGNLKAFSKQKVRCPKCARKYRRMPLKGSCLGCGNLNITLTVHEGSVRKYLQICKEIADKYAIDPYTRQRIALLESSVESLFQNDKVKKSRLTDFMTA